MHLMLCDYDAAYEYAESALKNCPKTLTLDIIMLSINLIIIKLCQRQFTVKEALIELELLSNQYPIIEDPWYEFQLLYNRRQLAEIVQHEEVSLETVHERYISEYCNAKTKFYILKYLSVENIKIELCLGLSPNWRY